jgi:hypothetical protein
MISKIKMHQLIIKEAIKDQDWNTMSKISHQDLPI